MKTGLSDYISIIKTISSLISIKASVTQAMLLFEMSIKEITEFFNGDFAFIYFRYVLDGGEEQEFSRSYGLPEEQCIFINNFVRSNISPSNPNFRDDNQYLYHISQYLSSDISSNEPIRSSGVKTLMTIPLLALDTELGSFSIYFTSNKTISKETMDFLSVFGELLANSYISRISHQNLLDKEVHRYDYFWKSYEATLILDEHLNILDANEIGNEILGIALWVSSTNRDTNRPKFTDFIDRSDTALVVTTIQNLNIGDLSKQISVDWRYKLSAENRPEVIKIIFGFTKVSNRAGNLRIIASGRTHQMKEPVAVSTTHGDDENIIAKLSDFKDLFTKKPGEAARLAKDEFFPAAFAFVVNEETGPIPLVSAPEYDLGEEGLVESAVRLMVALNTDQIESQYYIIGSSPWSDPDGELRWIAFSRHNPNARGNVEFHLLGLVIQRNLLNVLHKMMSIILGVLLGAMNTYLGIIEDDNADFCSVKFDGDRNFSTISLIREALDELRVISSEVLGATLTGQDDII